jgi:putative oxidoreductase
MKKFPFLSLHQSLLVLRVSVALIFFSHAVVRILVKGSFAQFGESLNQKGWMFGNAIVLAITIFEMGGSIAMGLGFLTKHLAAGFIAMLLAGIVIIHAKLGWFVGEHGTGGSEYSFILIVALLVIAADNTRHKIIA